MQYKHHQSISSEQGPNSCLSSNHFTQELGNNSYVSDSDFIKSWQGVHGDNTLHIFYNHKVHNFWAILQGRNGNELIPGTKNGFELIKVPMLESRAIKQKITNGEFPFYSPSKLIEFFRKELRYPIIKESIEGYTIQLNGAGLLGGGAGASRTISPSRVSGQTEVNKNSKEFIQVRSFLLDRYKIRVSADQDVTKDVTKDEQLVNELAGRIYKTLPSDQPSSIDKHLAEFIDEYEEEYFDDIVLQVIGKLPEQGKPQLAEYIKNFNNIHLCLELLKKGYFSKERAKGGIEQVVSKKILSKIAEEAKPLIPLLQAKAGNEKGQKEDKFENLIIMLEFKEKVQSQLKLLPKIKINRILLSIKSKLHLQTDDQQEIIDQLCASNLRKKIYNEDIKERLEKNSTKSPSSPANFSKAHDIEVKFGIAEDASDTTQEEQLSDLNQINNFSYLDKLRLNVLNELNLLDHELSTVVELHNLLKAEMLKNNADSSNPSPKSSRLEDIKSLLMSIVRGYRENEANLEANELDSLLPLAYVQDDKIFRAYLECFLADLRTDILFDTKKVRMLSFILISAMRNPNFRDYLRTDDLIQCLKILKPKIEDLSITSENVNIQEALNSLNDILFLMGFIGVKGIKDDYPKMVQEFTKYMETHGLEKAFNTLTGKAKDPSLAFKREYALEALKRIEGTNFEEWEGKWEKLKQAGSIAVNIGKGVFLSDISSINEALLEIKDMIMEYHTNKAQSWYDHVNDLRFLSQEPIERIFKELFGSNRRYSQPYTFFVAEFILSVLAQPHRKLREKKVAIQALWSLTNGYDYRISNKNQIYLTRSIQYRFNRDIHSYVRTCLLNIAQKSDIDFSLFIRKLVESPLRIEIMESGRIDLPLLVKSREKISHEDNPGKKLYIRILMEKKPRLYALARIQERSEKTLDVPAILVEFIGINKDKECDETFMRTVGEKLNNTRASKVKEFIQSLQELDAHNFNKVRLLELMKKMVSHKEESKLGEEKAGEREINQIKDIIFKKFAKINEANTSDLLHVLEDFLNEPSKIVLLVQGDAGAGKTLLLRLFEQKLWKRYNMLSQADSKNRNRLPIRIALSEVRSFDKAVDEFLLHNGCNIEAINDIKKEPVIILFDGYDEINQYINLYNLNKLETWKDAKVIFTSRKENLTSLKEDYIFCFTPGKDKQKVLSYTIKPLSEDQIKKYFEAQVNENEHKIQKLEDKLKELTSNNQPIVKISKTIELLIEYVKNFPQSEQFEQLKGMLAFLEEQLPEIGKIHKEMVNLKKQEMLEVLPLKETVQKYVNEFRRLTNNSYLESMMTKMESDLKVIQEVEIELETTSRDDQNSVEILEPIKTMIRGLIKLGKAKPFLQKLENIFSHTGKCASKIINEETSMTGNNMELVQKLREKFKESEKNANQEHFKEVAQKLSKGIESMKNMEKKLRETYPDEVGKDTILIETKLAEDYVKTIERFTDFDKLKIAFDKLLKAFDEYHSLKDELIQLMKCEETKSKSSQNTKIDTNKAIDLEKLVLTISKVKEKLNKIHEILVGDLKVFEFELLTSPFNVEDLFYELVEKGPIEGIDFGQRKVIADEFQTLKIEFAIFRKGETVGHNVIECFEKSLNQIDNIVYLEQVNILLRKVKGKIIEVYSSIKYLRALEAQSNQGSEMVQELEKQISNLRYSNQTKSQVIIQKLDEILQEIKTLENEFKAGKDGQKDEPMIVKALQKQVKDLKKFTEKDNLKFIIQKFKDIITSPFMLKMLLQTLLKYPNSSANRAELYRLFANIHFEREKEKLLQSEKIPPKFNIIDSFYQYSKDLAVNMFIRKITSLQAKSSGYKVLGIIEGEKKDIWNRFFDDRNLLTKLSKRGAQIIEDDGLVRFVHKSILEYFAARQFHDEIVDYNPDDLEPYKPCLNQGPVVDNETAVYLFLRDIADSEITKDPKEVSIFDKKLLELFNSVYLQKIFGNDFENNFLYPNLLLLVLLRRSLIKKIMSLQEDSPAFIMIVNIFKWIFSTSKISIRYVEMICKAYEADTRSYKGMNCLLSLYYHHVTKKEEGGEFKDSFITAKRDIKINVMIKRKNTNRSIAVKDGNIQEIQSDEYSWAIDGKLFIHDSMDSIVVFRDQASSKSLAYEPREEELSGKVGEQHLPVMLSDAKNPWEERGCKWILRVNLSKKTEFSLVSIADPTINLNGYFQKIEDYEILFQDLCGCDVHTKNVSQYFYECLTCTTKVYCCKNCKEKCHKDHKTRDYGSSTGYCDCRFAGCCELANGCTERFPEAYKNVVMFKCTQCPPEERKILCLACKNHHTKDHQSFEKLSGAAGCECDCVSNRTKIVAQIRAKGDHNNYGDDDPSHKNDENDQDEEEDNQDGLSEIDLQDDNSKANKLESLHSELRENTLVVLKDTPEQENLIYYYDKFIKEFSESYQKPQEPIKKQPLLNIEIVGDKNLKPIVDAPKHLTVYDKKLLEMLTNTLLQKVYGNDLDKSFFYPNLLLLVLLRRNLVKKIMSLQEDSPAFIMIINVFKWIFSASKISLKYVEMISKAYEADTRSYKGMNCLLSLYYHHVTKKEEGEEFKDRFITAKRDIKINVMIKRKNLNRSITVKDGNIQEIQSDEYSWVIDGKLFIHDSMDSIVVFKDQASGKYLSIDPQEVELSGKVGEQALPVILGDTKNPWKEKGYKWILRVNLNKATEFNLTSLADPTINLNGYFQKIEDYEMLFQDLCGCDVHTKNVSQYFYECLTCTPKVYCCKKCMEKCHKDHNLKAYGWSTGYCDCRFAGCCELANGCTERFPDAYRNVVMFKCTQCPPEARKILCLACKNHHTKEHQSFERVSGAAGCECDCVSKRTKIIAHVRARRDHNNYDLDGANLELNDAELRENILIDNIFKYFDSNQILNNKNAPNDAKWLEEERIKLQEKLSNQTFKNVLDKEKITDYYEGFIKTFVEVYLASQLIVTKQVVRDSETTPDSGVLSALIPFTGVAKTKLPKGIESLDQLIHHEEIMASAKKMKLLASNTTILSQLVKECAFIIINDPVKQCKIISTAQMKKDSHILFEKELTNITTDKLKNKLLTFIKTKLHGEAYKTLAAKQGNNDANSLIGLWISGKIGLVGASESTESQERIKQNFVFEITQKDNLVQPTKNACCQLF